MSKHSYWTNRSVLAFASGRDPVAEITRKVRDLVVRALDSGWTGPPFDPLALADALGISVRPSDDVPEARLVSLTASPCIEYNPNRPRGRMRYSIAHEIAHTLFPDYANETRYRHNHHEANADSWQLEALCNLAAAEILMPAAHLPGAGSELPSIEVLMRMRQEFDVSAEAILRRVIRAQEYPCAMFCASNHANSATYQLDYLVPSQTWTRRVTPGVALPRTSIVRECVAIGFTAKGIERWFNAINVRVECVGVPGYPGASLPRVVGAVVLRDTVEAEPSLKYLDGSAIEPRGEGPRVIVHVVNDKTPNWGGNGFAPRLRQKWPSVQEAFREWASSPGNLALGEVHFASPEPGIVVASIVAQKGYGPSEKPRIRYEALRTGLDRVAQEARLLKATIHMPRIGTGQAGGVWGIIEELIRSALCDDNIKVTVYDLPGSTNSTVAPQANNSNRQLSLMS
ncbi:MAG TPA: ImmA/IrrE family metallo-endopeptidase [Terriglobales bacterium]